MNVNIWTQLKKIIIYKNCQNIITKTEIFLALLIYQLTSIIG